MYCSNSGNPPNHNDKKKWQQNNDHKGDMIPHHVNEQNPQ